MNIRSELVDQFGDDELLFADGFDDAILGVSCLPGGDNIVCYDYEKCVDILADDAADDAMTHFDAMEYMDFNVVGSYVGKRTPMFIHTL
jgi:hypothetical protein